MSERAGSTAHRGGTPTGVSESLVARVLHNAQAAVDVRNPLDQAASRVYAQQQQQSSLGSTLLARRQQQEAAILAAQNQHIAAHNQQVLAAAAIQQQTQLGSRATLADSQMIDARQLREAQLRDAQLIDAQLMDAQYRDAQYLQQLAQFQDAPPMMVYIPPAAVDVVAHTRNRQPEILDLTDDKDDVEDEGTNAIQKPSERGTKRRTSSGDAAQASKRRAATASAPFSRRSSANPPSPHNARRSRNASSQNYATAQASIAAAAATAAAPSVAAGLQRELEKLARTSTTTKTTTAHAPASTRPAADRGSADRGSPPKYNTFRRQPKVLGEAEIGDLARELLNGRFASGRTAHPVMLSPLIITPQQLRHLSGIMEATIFQRTQTEMKQHQRTIQKQKETIETLKKQCSAKEKLTSREKKKYEMEIEDIRQQSERAMRAYMKATVHAFEKLQEEQSKTDMSGDED